MTKSNGRCMGCGFTKRIDNYEIIKELALRRKIVTEGCVKELSKGALGCLMSHYKLWEHEFLQKNKDDDYWVLIVEDDVLFHPQLKNEHVNAYMAEWPADARLIKLGWMFNDYWHSKNIKSHKTSRSTTGCDIVCLVNDVVPAGIKYVIVAMSMI